MLSFSACTVLLRGSCSCSPVLVTVHAAPKLYLKQQVSLKKLSLGAWGTFNLSSCIWWATQNSCVALLQAGHVLMRHKK